MEVSPTSIGIYESGFTLAQGTTSESEQRQLDAENNNTAGQSSNSGGFTFNSGCSGIEGTLKGMMFAGCWTKLVVGLGGMLLALAGILFDVFIALTLSPTLLQQDYILTAWSSMRDLANLTFILGMIVVGLMMIVQGTTGNWKNTLTRLIIVALLLNFSLFFSKVIIDVGNIMGGFFYNQVAISGTNEIATSQLSGLLKDEAPEVKDVSKNIIGQLNLMNLLGEGTFKRLAGEDGSNQSFFFIFNVCFIAIALVGSYSVATTGFLFLSRTINLIMLMIVSPLAFVAYFIPQGQSLAKRWFAELINKSFCVAVYLFFVYLLITILSGMNQVQPGGGGVDASFETVLIKIVIQLTFVFGILGMANKKAKGMCEGEMGGIGSIALKAGTGAIALASGGAARASIGRLGRSLANSSAVGSLATSDSRFKRAIGNTLYSGGEAAQNATFGMKESYSKALNTQSKNRIDRADALAKNNKDAYKATEKANLWKSLSDTEKATLMATERAKAGNVAYLSPEDLEKKAQDQLAIDRQDKLNDAVSKRTKEEAKAFLETGRGSGIDWVLAGGVAAYNEAADSYKIVDDGEERKKRQRAQQVAEKQRMGTAMQLERNELDRLGETVTDALTSGKIVLDKKTVNKLDDRQEFQALAKQLERSMTETIRDPEGNPQQVVNTGNLKTTLDKLKEDLGRVGEQFSPQLVEKKAAMEEAEKKARASDLSSDEIIRAQQEAERATKEYKDVQQQYKQASSAAIERTTNVAKTTLKSKLDTEIAMGTATQIQVQDEIRESQTAATEGDSSDVDLVDVTNQ